MKISEELLHSFFEQGKNIRRGSWPVGDHISADGAEGGTIWYYEAEEDELSPKWAFGFHEMAAGDWEILP